MNIYATFYIDNEKWKRYVVVKENIKQAEQAMRDMLNASRSRFTIMWIEIVTIKQGNVKRPLPRGE